MLRHKAYFKAGTLAELPSGSLLKGSLVHRLFEDFFSVHKKWQPLDETQIKRWIDKRLPVLLEEEGALLLQPGRAAEKEAFEEIARHALITLVSRLKAAKVNDIAVETYQSTPFLSGTLNGYIDMLLICADGSEKVLRHEVELRQVPDGGAEREPSTPAGNISPTCARKSPNPATGRRKRISSSTAPSC